MPPLALVCATNMLIALTSPAPSDDAGPVCAIDAPITIGSLAKARAGRLIAATATRLKFPIRLIGISFGDGWGRVSAARLRHKPMVLRDRTREPALTARAPGRAALVQPPHKPSTDPSLEVCGSGDVSSGRPVPVRSAS